VKNTEIFNNKAVVMVQLLLTVYTLRHLKELCCLRVQHKRSEL